IIEDKNIVQLVPLSFTKAEVSVCVSKSCINCEGSQVEIDPNSGNRLTRAGLDHTTGYHIRRLFSADKVSHHYACCEVLNGLVCRYEVVGRELIGTDGIRQVCF